MAPPPPVTPSPHRFIIPGPKKQSSQAPPARRAAVQQQATPLSGTQQFSNTQQQQFNSTPRFNTTPRFTNSTPSGPSQRSVHVQNLHVQNAPTVSSPLIGRADTPAQRPSRLQETIEDDFPADEELEDEEELDDDIQQSIEDVDILESSEKYEFVEDDAYEMDFPESASKRRRLNSSPIPGIYRDVSNRTGLNDGDAAEDLDEFDVLSSSITEISSPSAPLPPAQPRNQTQSKPIPRFLPPSTPQSRFQTTTGLRSTPLSSSSYLNQPPSTTIKPGSAQTIFSKPPRFRPPSPTSQSHTGGNEEPLPDIFSPRRRGGEKYMIGGLANELRSWIFNIGNEPRSGSGVHGFANSTSSSSTISTTMTRGQVQNSNDQWKSKILIDEMSGGYGASGAGMTLIRGRQIHSQLEAPKADTTAFIGGPDESAESPSDNHNTEVKMLLAGTGIVDGLNRAKKLDTGMQIGVRGPTWEILVGGEKWHVAVNWRVLDRYEPNTEPEGLGSRNAEM